jgi:hypothetical protein
MSEFVPVFSYRLEVSHLFSIPIACFVLSISFATSIDVSISRNGTLFVPEISPSYESKERKETKSDNTAICVVSLSVVTYALVLAAKGTLLPHPDTPIDRLHDFNADPCYKVLPLGLYRF